MSEPAIASRGRGYVRIERGPLTFMVRIDKPLTREQLVGLEPVARVLEEIELLFPRAGRQP